MSEQPATELAKAARRLEEIAAALSSSEVDDREAAQLTDEAARLASELVAEAETEMRRASATDE